MISLTSPVETLAHRWPAGLKLLFLCGVTLALFQTTSLTGQFAFFAVTAALYALPGRAFCRAGLSQIWVLWPFVVMVMAWHVLTRDIEGGLLICLRMLTAVALANLVTMTTRLSDMMEVMRWIMYPLARFGLPVRAVEVAMALVIRFTPVLVQKGTTLGLAWKARSPRRPGWRIIIPFVVTTIDDAEHVAEALRARGGL